VIALSRRLDLYEQIKNTIMISGSDDPRRARRFGAALPVALGAVTG